MILVIECLISKRFKNNTFCIVYRAYKRKAKVVMKKKDTKANKLIDRFWLCFTHPDFKDANDNYIPQGYAEVSIEILPKALADET